MNFRYDLEKNAWLVTHRGVGFEEMIVEIANGNLITIKSHHNAIKYPHQKIMYIRCLDNIYLVPYVIESDGTIFLKTLYPSRKAKKLLSQEDHKKSAL